MMALRGCNNKPWMIDGQKLIPTTTAAAAAVQTVTMTKDIQLYNKENNKMSLEKDSNFISQARQQDTVSQSFS